METYPIILGGKKKDTAEIADIRFPYTGEIYAKVCQASQGDLDQAVTAAVRGFEKTRHLSSGVGFTSFRVSLMRSMTGLMS